MQSGRAALASSGVISGSGLAMAKMMGLGAMARTMSCVTAPLMERPKNTSAPSSACVSVRAFVSTAWADFHWFMPSVRPRQITPLVSHMRMFSGRIPMARISSAQAMEAAPAPLMTKRVSFRSRPVRCAALMRPAAATMAVPCWSSWKTGMSISSLSRASITKHSGALMSSRLIPPKEAPR